MSSKGKYKSPKNDPQNNRLIYDNDDNDDNNDDIKEENNIEQASRSNSSIQRWCTALFYWIPIRHLCFVGNLALFIFPFLDNKFGSTINFIEWLLYWYIQIFAIIGLFIEIVKVFEAIGKKSLSPHELMKAQRQ